MAEAANRELTALERAFVNSAPTAASQAARKAAILRGIYANTGGPRLEYRGRNAMNRGVLQGMGEVAKYGAIVSALPPDVQREVEDAIAQAVGEDPMCELPSVEELGEAMAAFQIAEEETAEEASLPGAAEAAEMKEGGGGAAAPGGAAGNGNGRRNSRRAGRRAGSARRVQRGGAIGDFFRAFFRLTCGRTAVVVQDELAQKGRQGAVMAAVAQIENDNPAYMETVRARWRTQLRERIAQALLAGAAVDLAGPQYTVWATTSLLTMLSSFIPNITLYGAAAGVVTGAGAIAAVGAPVGLAALNAYLGVSLVRATLKRAMMGAEAARSATLAGAFMEARAAIAGMRGATPEQIMDIVDDLVLSWLRFVSDVLFFGNDELLFRIVGIETREEKAASRALITEIRAQGARNAAAFEAAVAARVHPSRRFRIMQQAAEDESARAIAVRLATQSREIQTNAPVVVGVNMGVGPNGPPGFLESAAPRGRGRAGSAAGAGSRGAAGMGALGSLLSPGGAGALAAAGMGEEELNANLGVPAAMGGILGAAAPKTVENIMALVRNNGRFFSGERGAGGGLASSFTPTPAELASEIRRVYGQLNRADKNAQWVLNAGYNLMTSEKQGAGLAAAAAEVSRKRKAKGRAGSVAAEKRGKSGAGGGAAGEERRMYGGARRRTARRTAKKSKKHTRRNRKH